MPRPLRAPRRPPPGTPTRLRPYLVFHGIVVVVATTILVALGSRDRPEGACSGIGFGCQLWGADLAGFAALFIVPIALAVMLLGHLFIALFHWWWYR